MVLVKAIFGQETRKFPLKSDATFQDLGSKLLEVFPQLKGKSITDLVLLYRDDDGDVITVSSDEELQTALQHSTGDAIKFMVQVKTGTGRPVDSDDDDSFGLEHLVDSFFHRPMVHNFHSSPFEHSVFGSHFPFGYGTNMGTNWQERRRSLQAQEEKLRQQRLYEEKMRQARLEHLKEMREKARKEQEEMREKARKEWEEMHKKAAEGGTKDIQPKDQVPLVPDFPVGWNVTPFGTWTPVVQQVPGYTVHSWGPWGYKAVYDSTSSKKETSDVPTEEPTQATEEPTQATEDADQ